ncbi:lysophospholipase [Flagellatimonas centrodinii]|uniref:alpha/beta hydrolase n=1 Tax=Flagellatimonas centrodinii TaxID=2806210 RepID=UPI001FEF2101|nr:alpha/beta hydrolase [Flagellatimonas centrodinii]ULQ45600.1 lysophospholipase [Flagellatimonas centrodinii]
MTPPTTTIDGHFEGVGGSRIVWQGWAPVATPRTVIVLVHGAGEHVGRYGYLIAHLLAAGHAVVALDHPGHGRSGGPRGLVPDLHAAAANLKPLIEHARRRWPQVPLLMLGHSMGGAIATGYAISHEMLDGLILSAPALSLDGTPTVLRWLARAVAAVAPRLPVFAIDADTISSDPAEVQAYRDDPQMLGRPLPAGTVAMIDFAARTLPGQMEKLRLPLLILQGDADRLVPVAAGPLALRCAGSTDKTLMQIPGGRHELFNEAPALRAEALRALCGWIDQRWPAP